MEGVASGTAESSIRRKPHRLRHGQRLAVGSLCRAVRPATVRQSIVSIAGNPASGFDKACRFPTPAITAIQKSTHCWKRRQSNQTRRSGGPNFLNSGTSSCRTSLISKSACRGGLRFTTNAPGAQHYCGRDRRQFGKCLYRELTDRPAVCRPQPRHILPVPKRPGHDRSIVRHPPLHVTGWLFHSPSEQPDVPQARRRCEARPVSR